MGAKTKEVGGGASSGVATDWTKFLGEGLTSGNFGGYTNVSPSGKGGVPPSVNAISQTQGVAGALNNMLQGNIGDPLNVQSYFQNQFGQGGLQNLPSLGYNAPQFQGANNFNPNIGVRGVSSTYQSPDWMQTALQNIQLANTQNAPGQRLATNLDSEFATGVRGILEREQQKGVADLRARYGVGSSGLGSNAQFAEGNYRAEALPQIAAAMGQINQQEQGIDLGNRQLLADYILGATGLNNQSILGLNSQNLQQGLAQNQFNLQNEGTRAGMALDASKANQAAALQAAIASKGNILQMLGMQNNFNLANAGMQYNADAQNVANQLQNQQMGNQYNLGIGNLGLGLQSNQLQAQQFGLGQIFNSMNQINQLGTAQRQNVMVPGIAGQITGALSQGLNLFNGIRGAMSGNQQSPVGGPAPTQFSMPTYNTPQFGNPQYVPTIGR